MLLRILGAYWSTLIIVPFYFLAIGIAVLRWRRHPWVSRLTVFAFLVFFVIQTGSVALVYWQGLLLEEGASQETIGFAAGLYSGIAWVPHVAAEIALIGAIFGWRTRQGLESPLQSVQSA